MANARVNDNMMVFTGNANPTLAAGVAKQLGIPLGKADVSKFSDGEVAVRLTKTFVVKTFLYCNRPALRPMTT
jgi:ribose-phosphate pyrophosphokinase